jgi:hypothetical protein
MKDFSLLCLSFVLIFHIAPLHCSFVLFFYVVHYSFILFLLHCSFALLFWVDPLCCYVMLLVLLLVCRVVSVVVGVSCY